MRNANDKAEATSQGAKLGVAGIVHLLEKGGWRGRFTYSRLDEAVLLDGLTFRANDLTRIQVELQVDHGARTGVSDLERAVSLVAENHSFHPVCDWLTGLSWDGTRRLDRLLIEYLGADDTALNRKLGALWLIGACARAFEPGCPVEGALVLLGSGGGRGAGGLCSALVPVPTWAGAAAIDIKRQDALVEVHGAWLFELADNESLATSSIDARKAFIRRRVDRYRPPFHTGGPDHRRQAVFVATTTLEAFVERPFGGAEWWTVIVGHSDLDALRRDRDQLFAEAFSRYRVGESWSIDEEDVARLAAVQHALVPPDSREERLAAWVAKQVRPFTVGEAIHGGLGLCPEPKEEPKLRLAVGKMLGRLRCTWARPRAEGGGRFTRWERPVVR